MSPLYHKEWVQDEQAGLRLKEGNRYTGSGIHTVFGAICPKVFAEIVIKHHFPLIQF